MGTNITQKQLETEFNKVNSFWNKYGVHFNLRNINESLMKEKQNFGQICSDENIMLWFYNHYEFPKNYTIIVIFKDERTCQELGAGRHVGSNQTILISRHSDNKNFTWTIIHELGHVLGLYDNFLILGEKNIMANDGCIKTNFWPTNLNKKQVDIVINKTLEIYNNQNR